MVMDFDQCIDYSVNKASYPPRAIEIPWLMEQLYDPYFKIDKPYSVLDVGCCWSGVPFYLAESGFDVIGIDVVDIKKILLKHNPQPIDRDLSISVNFKFDVGSVFNLPYEDDSIDVVYSISVIEHLEAKWYEWWYYRCDEIWAGRTPLTYAQWSTSLLENASPPDQPVNTALSEMLRVARRKVVLTYEKNIRWTPEKNVIQYNMFSPYKKVMFETLDMRHDLFALMKRTHPNIMFKRPIKDYGVVIWK